MKELVDRLEIIRKRLDLNQIEFSALGKTKQTTYNNWTRGIGKPSGEFIFYLKKVRPREIDLEWLFTGYSVLHANEPSEHYKTECEEKLELARQVIEAQKQTIEVLKGSVSDGVSKSPKLKLAAAL
jgi:transcriptional regulator with XRE-family HTH domain